MIGPNAIFLALINKFYCSSNIKQVCMHEREAKHEVI